MNWNKICTEIINIRWSNRLLFCLQKLAIFLHHNMTICCLIKVYEELQCFRLCFSENYRLWNWTALHLNTNVVFLNFSSQIIFGAWIISIWTSGQVMVTRLTLVLFCNMALAALCPRSSISGSFIPSSSSSSSSSSCEEVNYDLHK